MAARPVVIQGRTDILAAIYDSEYLPSAILDVTKDGKSRGGQPVCLHSLRTEDASFFDAQLLRWAEAIGVVEKDIDDNLRVLLYKFYEDYPSQSDTCHGCYFSGQGSGKLTRHQITKSGVVSTKSTEDCA